MLAADRFDNAVRIRNVEQVIKDTATTLRAALKKAIKAAGLDCKNPLKSSDKGRNLTYILAIP